MTTRSTSLTAMVLTLAMSGFAGTAAAVPLLCEDGSSESASSTHLPVSACPGAGISVDGSLWDTQNEILVSFQTPRSEQVDAWFASVFTPLMDTGNWRFVKIRDEQGRMVQLRLIGNDAAKNVPEPGTLVLLSLGLLGAGIARRRKRA